MSEFGQGVSLLCGSVGDKPVTCLISRKDEEALPPLFDSPAQARAFLTYAGPLDVLRLDWGTFSTGDMLLRQWREEGKPARRAGSAALVRETTLMRNTGSRKLPWYVALDLIVWCFPLFVGHSNGNRDVYDILKRAKADKKPVIGPTDVADPMQGALYMHFVSKRAGSDFLARLNTWLLNNWHRAYEADPVKRVQTAKARRMLRAAKTSV